MILQSLRRGHTSECLAWKLSTNDATSNPRSQGNYRVCKVHYDAPFNSESSCSANSPILLPLVAVAFITSYEIFLLTQVTCEGHVKWVTDEKSRKDRGMSKGGMMSLERCIHSRMRYRAEIASTGVKKNNKGLKALRQGAGETRREQ